ncbi:MAG: hypothetical protein BWY61_01446 [Firmicutes bacterium ADurb.Bin354]|nr:MAG: hypothetical protein BWY61_01446 [Firmicutes bacterium ADurb.Bin354]
MSVDIIDPLQIIGIEHHYTEFISGNDIDIILKLFALVLVSGTVLDMSECIYLRQFRYSLIHIFEVHILAELFH